MDPIIGIKIPTQGFELVRDYIGYVLKLELENQNLIQDLNNEVGVYQERSTPISNDEDVVVNVSLSSGTFTSKTQKDSQGNITYNIDVYSTGINDSNETGSLNSSKKLHKYIGMIRYIFMYSEYKTLTLPAGIIGGSSIDNFEIMDSRLSKDSDYVRQARIELTYRIQEAQDLIKGVLNEGNNTGVRLELTENGYKYVLNL